MQEESKPSPKELKLFARQEELLAAARLLFIQRGLVGLSIDQLAKGTGYSRPTIYGHFTSRHALLAAIAERNLEVTTELIEKAEGFTGSFRERAFGLILAYEVMARFDEDEFHVTEALGMPWVRSVLPEGVGKKFAMMVASYSNSLTDLVAGAVEEGDLVLSDGMTVGNVVFHSLSMTYGVYTSIVKQRIILVLSDPVDPWAEARAALNSYWDGIGWRKKGEQADHLEAADRFLKEVFPQRWLELEYARVQQESGLNDETG